MSEASEAHNAATLPILRAMVEAVGPEPGPLWTLTESILLGVAMLRFPDDGRKRAQAIQAIADGSIDRCADGAPSETGEANRG